VKELEKFKNIAKDQLKNLVSGSNLDSDLSEEKVNKVQGVQGKDVINHFIGKKKLNQEQIEALKKGRKIGRYLP
jgi:predicted transcriptional regulator